MVLQKRLDYGSRGYQVPAVLQIPSSARGKRSTRRKKNAMYAFDLLATVAGKLLKDDQENSSNIPDINGAVNCCINTSAIKPEQSNDGLPPKDVAVEKDSCNGCVVGPRNAFPRQASTCFAENSSTQNGADSSSVSLTGKSNMLVKDLLIGCTKSVGYGPGLGTIPEDGSIGVCYTGSARSAGAKEVQQSGPQLIKTDVDSNSAALHGLAESLYLGAKPPALVSSASSPKVPFYSDDTHNNSSPLCQGGMQHAADRDDDDNSSRCSYPSTAGNKGYTPHCIGNRRMRRLFASKLRKGVRNRIRRENFNKGKLAFYGRKIPTTRQKVQRAMFTRKRLFQHHFTPSFDKGVLTKGSGTSFSMEGPKPLCGSDDYRVKLSIKSFNIPELLIEIPENATVGSLKKTVMDAVTAIIEGGLRIGVLLQGKNVRDDDKTLRQAGICHGEKLDAIDFTLESDTPQASPAQATLSDKIKFLDAGEILEPLARIKSEEPFPGASVRVDNPQPTPSSPSCPMSDPCSLHSPVEGTAQETSANSQAIIAVPSLNDREEALVPLCKAKRSDVGRRRIRRPFSVAEVEALVQAVEQLGTGRWRDVKIRAFENDEHRTYVDLKDKWKTLVHTASISPQQRRGEPVPQVLLNRVLSVQAYWSQQQADLQDNPPAPEICLA